MPLHARLHIKAGLIYFAAALALGVVMAAQPVFNLNPMLASLRPVFLHLLTVGWITQIIIGVAYWMFPKMTKQIPRGSTPIAWGVFLLLNSGLILRVVGETLLIYQPSMVWGIALAISAVLQVLAGWLFIANTWTRVKER